MRHFYEKRAIEELNSDWTASQEVADRLMREHGVPFRIGHHFASSMVGLARKAGFTPLNFPYDEAVRLYREEIEKEFPQASPVFPMNEADLQSALDPREIVHARTTAGSANPTEVLKMHGQLSEELTRLRKDTDRRVDRINRALETLQRDVAALITQDRTTDIERIPS